MKVLKPIKTHKSIFKLKLKSLGFFLSGGFDSFCVLSFGSSFLSSRQRGIRLQINILFA